MFQRLRYLFLIPFQGNCHVKCIYKEESLTFSWLHCVKTHTLVSSDWGRVLCSHRLLSSIYNFFLLNAGLEVKTKPYTNLVLSYKQSSYSPHRWKTWNKPVYFVAWVQLLDTLQGNLLLLFIQLCPTLCNPMDWSTSVFNISQSLLKLYVHRVGDAIQPSHLLSSSPPA